MAGTTVPNTPPPAIIPIPVPMHTIPPDFNLIPQRARFFQEFDKRPANQAVIHFCKEHKDEEWCPSQPTASRWLAKRQALLEARVRPAKKKGSKRKDIGNVIDLLVSRQIAGEPMDKEEWEDFKEMGNCSRVTLKRRMKANRVVQPKIKKMTELEVAEKEKRVKYGEQHNHETVESLWQWIHWTGEACVERAVAVDQFIMSNSEPQLLASSISPVDREDGLLMETDTPGRPQVLWLAASVSWHHKSRLIFWNDRAYEDVLSEWQALRPRRGLKGLSEDSFRAQMREWQNKRDSIVNTPVKRQIYSQQILPQHISYVQSQKVTGSPAVLAYSNAEPLVHTSDSLLPSNSREKFRLPLHALPSQSPDIDPMYACFYLLNEKLKHEHGDQMNHMDYWKLRHAIESAWDSIQLKEIQDYISDLPRRCEKLAGSDGSRVKGSVW